MDTDNKPLNLFSRSGINEQLKLTGKRIAEARKSLGISAREMAALHGIDEAEYLHYESGERDCPFSFLLKTAQRFNLDINALVTGESPHLSFYTLTRNSKIAGLGTKIERRPDFEYFHQASQMKKRLSEPYVVRAPFLGDDAPMHMSVHAGQEFDFVLQGKLKVKLDNQEEILEAGDSLYYDSGHPHGMIAYGGEDCIFIAVVIKSDSAALPAEEKTQEKVADTEAGSDLICHRYIEEIVDENGLIKDVKYHVPEDFHFSYDVLDELAKKYPQGRAMRYVSADRTQVKDFTYRDISQLSQRAANYFTSLGIRKGDKVMLILKRHYQYWYIINALHRIGAVAIPATNQLLAKDIEYRLNAAEVKMIITTSDQHIIDSVNEAAPKGKNLKFKMCVNGKQDGWLGFDDEISRYSSVFPKPEDHKVTDPMLMYFSSGTTGYPKMVLHNYSYPIGFILPARWWQNIHPGGLHFTISDTGWGKAAWGKHYGQWFAEAAIFVFDFDRFHAEEILPLFKEHNITTFCAPPTMYRFFIKEDLSKYDFSSIKYAATAGEALNSEVFQQFYKATGLKIMEAFGQTETTAVLANFRGTTPVPGSMGKRSPQYPIDLLDADGNPVPAGQTGEICIKANPGEIPGLFQGYYNSPDKNQESWHDGYYHMGDVAWCDEKGYYWYVGRSDDVIKTSGYRIGPFEVESVIMELPYVLECAVTGAPDPVRGQVIKAWIVTVKGTVTSDELKKEIQDYVKAHTAPYKYPRQIEFVSELPKTPSGKIKRTELRKLSQQNMPK